MPHRKDLEIDQDLAFQHREWRVQRIGWWALSAFVLAAALGLFGGGLLSRARAGETNSPLWIEYERFIRLGAPTRIAVHVQHAGPADQGVQLRLSRQYFEAFRIERMVPEPEAISVADTDVTFRFDPAASAASFTLLLDLEPLRAGRHRADIRERAGSSATFAQFVFF